MTPSPRFSYLPPASIERWRGGKANYFSLTKEGSFFSWVAVQHCGQKGYGKQTIELRTSKGQLTSKCPLSIIIWTKIPTNFFPGFLP